MSKVQDAATSAALTTAVLQAPSRHPSKHLRAWLETGLGTSLLQFVAVAVFFLCWEVATELGWLSEFLMGKPSGIWARFVSSLMDGSLLINTGYTLWEAVLGFVIGTALGTVMGLSLWYSKWVEQLVGPFIAAINSVPKIALAPIVLLWFGTGLLSKVVLVVSMTAIVALIAAHQAAKDADKDLQALMFSMGGATNTRYFLAWWCRHLCQPSWRLFGSMLALVWSGLWLVSSFRQSTAWAT